MANLKKREIAILVIAGLFVLYAAYVYLFAGPVNKKAATGESTAKIETSVSNLKDDLNRSKLTEFDEYVIKKTEKESGKDPFMKKELYRAWASKDGLANSAAAKMVYSGYLESGRNRLAIINGIEYRAGEELKEEGYVLKQITPLKVLILDKHMGTELEIPIQE